MTNLMTPSNSEKQWRLLRCREAAVPLGISVTKTYAMAASGELPTVRIGRAVRIPEHKLLEWINERTQQG